MTDELEFPSHLTFSRRFGYEPLPEPMRLEEISDDLRREIWNLMYRTLRDNSRLNELGNEIIFHDDFRESIISTLGKFEKVPENRIRTGFTMICRRFEYITLNGEFNRILDFLEIMIDEWRPDIFATQVNDLFDGHAASYRLDTSRRPYHFFPCSSPEQGDAVRQAIETLHKGGMDGAASHLRQAKEHMNAQRYANAIADSIHAVESVARTIEPKASTLGRALPSLERAGLLNREFKQALEKLYNYTNAKPGIRHAKQNQEAADVGLDEAMLMFGACASFAAYLTQRHQSGN